MSERTEGHLRPADQLLADLVDLLAELTLSPIILHIRRPHGAIETFYSASKTFPTFCAAVWSVGDGHGKKRCEADMADRALRLFEENVSVPRCYLSMPVASEAIRDGDEVTAVLQYLEGTTPATEVAATSADREDLERLLAAGRSASRGPQKRTRFMKAMLPSVKDVIARHVKASESQYNNELDARHEFQEKIQAARWGLDRAILRVPEGTPGRDSVERAHSNLEEGIKNFNARTAGRYLPKTRRDWRPIWYFVQQSIRFVQDRAEARQVEIRHPKLVDQMTQVLVSVDQIQTVFDNILENAVKYSRFHEDSPTEHRYVEISGRLQADGYLVTVTNFGPGVAPEEMSRIFEEGYRGRFTQRRPGGGEGLAICRRYVDDHRGRLSLRSLPYGDPGVEGPRHLTIVDLWLPIRTAEVDQ